MQDISALDSVSKHYLIGVYSHSLTEKLNLLFDSVNNFFYLKLTL